jgi:hypothetical protein
MIDLLKTNGNWYKANLHCHTTVSDGKMTPQQVKDWYKQHGYSIVAITDHSKYVWHKELEDENFLPVAGVEAAFTCLDPNHPPLKYKLCHINFWAKDPHTAVYTEEEHTYDVGVMNRYIATMKKKGFLCGLNHPAWSLQSTEEIHGLMGLDTFEVYNHGSHFLDNNGDGQGHWALFLNSGKRAYCVAVDDNHAGFEADGSICDADDTLGGWIMISMPELSYSAFAEAMENGRFYATTGPAIDKLYIDEERDMLIVECSAVQRLLVKGIHTVKAVRINGKGDTITQAEIPLAPVREKEPYLRLELIDSLGRRAYSQPYWFD